MTSKGSISRPNTYNVPEDHITPSQPREEQVEEVEEFLGREERMSPAAVFGLKGLGVAVLPDPLVEGITEAIKGGQQMILADIRN